ncbi:ribonuclease domain-containing protein [Tellurirhabdus bombi]|uniref:ribonuclease domain-containing protein n=1 Tax=Tellurirhabdus bombi TaxID=2907205 RepID=UPI001F3331E5|nr:ribonuclease domain-containing protein [Tellurirhabdus bombi]
MQNYLHRFLTVLWLMLLGFSTLGCQSLQTDTHYSQSANKTQRQSQERHQKASRTKRTPEKYAPQRESAIPQKVYTILEYVQSKGRSPEGYVGGRRFGNYEGHLPRQDLSGQVIKYQEWDVNPKKKGKNRGAERLVTGSDRRAWYTRDHYNSFVEVK